MCACVLGQITARLSGTDRLYGKKRWIVENLLTKSCDEFLLQALAEVDEKGSMEKSGSLGDTGKIHRGGWACWVTCWYCVLHRTPLAQKKPEKVKRPALASTLGAVCKVSFCTKPVEPDPLGGGGAVEKATGSCARKLARPSTPQGA